MKSQEKKKKKSPNFFRFYKIEFQSHGTSGSGFYEDFPRFGGIFHGAVRIWLKTIFVCAIGSFYGYSMYYLLEWVLRMLEPDPDRAKMSMASSMVELVSSGSFQVTPSIL